MKAFHHMVCPCTLDGVCVVCPGTSELVGQHQQCRDGLVDHDVTTGALATAKPKAELIFIQDQVNNSFQQPIGATASFRMDISLCRMITQHKIAPTV